ncbi:hypothetical protein [Lysobacter gummosus]
MGGLLWEGALAPMPLSRPIRIPPLFPGAFKAIRALLPLIEKHRG